MLHYRRFDAVVCGHLFLLRTACGLQLFSRIPTAGVIHGIDAWEPPPRRSIRALVSRLDRFVSVSDFTRQRFLSWSGLPAASGTVIPNCVDLTRFTPGPRSEDLVQRYGLAGKRVLLTLARLDANERYKGVDEVLDALPTLIRAIPDLVYIVGGTGTDVPRLQARTAELGLSDSVRFLGYITEEEKEAHYRLADAFVMPGRGEGFGIVYLEAMACGTPVVASTADGSREAVLDGKLGFMADPDSPNSVRETILAALDASRGKRPSGLEYFSKSAFEERVQSFMDSWFRPAAGRGGPGGGNDSCAG
jgi:glycosyltransferase involved in cell wall biosynthesis